MTRILEWGKTADEVFENATAIRNLIAGFTPPAVVIISGGMDSAVCLALAKYINPSKLIGLTFNYGQLHERETSSAKQLGWHYETDIRTIDISKLADNFRTALKKDSDIAVPDHAVEGTIPPTYVPFRNSIFLTIAMGYAESWGYQKVFYGANAVDYSGYPDCRPEFVEAINHLAFAQTHDGTFKVEAPIINLTKKDIVELGNRLGVPWEHTWSCYRGNEIACGKCPSCELRLKGFEAAGIPDPLRYATN